MDINRPLSSRFKSSKPISTEVGKKGIDAAHNRAASSAEINSKLDLKEGQLLKGQIIDHRHNEVKLMVEPGNRLITAKLSGDMPLSIGQYASFIVSEATSDSIVLKLQPQEAQANDSIILKALAAAGIAVNARSKAIVEELLAQRMPVDKQTLQALIRQAAANREASPLSLVLMYKNNIPINSENLQQFQAYLEGTHQLLYKIKDITQNLSKILNTPASPETILSDTAASALLNPDLANQAAVFSNLQSGADSLAADTGAAGLLSPSSDAALLQAGLTHANAYPPADSGLVNNPLRQALAANDELIRIYQTNAETDLSQPPKLSNQVFSSNLTLSKVQATQLSEVQTLMLSEVQALMLSQDYQTFTLSDILTQEDISNLMNHLSAAPDPGGIKSSLADGSAQIGEALSYIQKTIYTLSKSVVTDLLASAEYGALLEKAFFRKWTLAPEKVAKQQSVEKFYKQLEDDIQRINKLIDTTGEADDNTSIAKPLNSLQNNLQFMKDLNNVFAFLQLPVEFKDRQLHADLYVLNKKKALNEKEQGLNVQLYLETANLGGLNIHVHMKDKQIQTVFYPEVREVEQIIKDNLPILTDSLQAKGYKVDAAVAEAENQPAVFKKLIEQNNQDNNISRYTFDIRT